MQLEAHIRKIPDFPKPGILFYDISTLLAHGEAWRAAVGQMADAVAGYRPQILAGIESRGFVFAAPVAAKLGLGFVMVRKKGKLPFTTVEETYELEYGSATVELHTDAVKPGQRVLL